MGVLSLPGRPIMGTDGMTVDRELLMDYIGEYADIDGPNRTEMLRPDGFSISKLSREKFKPNVEKLLPEYKSGW